MPSQYFCVGRSIRKKMRFGNVTAWHMMMNSKTALNMLRRITKPQQPGVNIIEEKKWVLIFD